MTHSLCLLALLPGVANIAGYQTGTAAGPPGCGYVAEVVVSLGGVTRHGRIVVASDGSIHLEHLDEQARHWVNKVMGPESLPLKGWDDRVRQACPIHRVWNRVAQNAVLAEVHTPNGSLKLSQHRLLASR